MDPPRGSSMTMVGDVERRLGWEVDALSIGAGRGRTMEGREAGEEESWRREIDRYVSCCVRR